MNDQRKSPEHAERQRRLSVALRENLKRRKAQVRGRRRTDAEPARASHDSAGIDDDKRKS
jgi:hypothetical protein